MNQIVKEYLRGLDEETLYRLTGVINQRVRKVGKQAADGDQVQQLVKLIDLADTLTDVHRAALVVDETAALLH